LPKIPKVIIQLFRDNQIPSDDNEEGNFKDFKVIFKSNYSSTASLNAIEQLPGNVRARKATVVDDSKTQETPRPKQNSKTFIC